MKALVVAAVVTTATTAVVSPAFASTDTTRPTTPARFHVAAATRHTVKTVWRRSWDVHGSGVAGYELFRNGHLVAKVKPKYTTRYVYRGLRPGRRYTFGIQAFDRAGNRSRLTRTHFRTRRPRRRYARSTREAQGKLGPYDNYSRITGTTSSTYIGNNVWSPIPGWKQTLHANNPGSWRVSANMPAGNTAVVSYPSIGANYGKITNEPNPLTRFASITSSFSERMHATRATSAWAAYDIWLGDPRGGSYEVMIQHDFANNGAIPVLSTATFNGQKWNFSTYGSMLIWKSPTNIRTGSVHILAMLHWLVSHRRLPADAGLWMIGYGWEICSTGGVNENFDVNAFSLQVAMK